MRVLIIDDERLARGELRRMLAAHPEVKIVGECANAPEGRMAIEEMKPDLVFLDVQMPGGSGFDMLGALDAIISRFGTVSAIAGRNARRSGKDDPGFGKGLEV